jgi:glutamate/aspartate transport system substrate-binding protein
MIAMRRPMRAIACILVVAAALAATSAHAATPAWPDALSARAAHIKATGVVRMGYRDAIVPFAYVGRDGAPKGYSIDLCGAIVEALADELGAPKLGIDYVRVTAQDRFERVVAGDADLECGATTITAARAERVAFSSVIFVTGTRIAVPRGSKVRGVTDLRGRPVAVVAGTTTEAALREVDRLRGLSLAFVTVPDYGAALDTLQGGRADAIAADEVLLRGLLAQRGQRDVVVVGPMLSFEPYGIVLPRDAPELARAAERALTELAASREIAWIYDRWFVRTPPGGRALDMPMGVELRRSLEMLGMPPD